MNWWQKILVGYGITLAISAAVVVWAFVSSKRWWAEHDESCSECGCDTMLEGNERQCMGCGAWRRVA